MYNISLYSLIVHILSSPYSRASDIMKEQQSLQQLQWIVEFTIERSKLEEFREYAKEMIDVVNKNEPGAQRYQWYIDDKDETKCIVSELYEDSDAGIAHLEGKATNTILVPKILSVAKITRFEVYGTPSKKLQEALATLNTKNYHFMAGYAR